MYRVKICGITTVEDALLAVDAGADAIGLNFYPKSSRCVSLELAGDIAEAIRHERPESKIEVFGVFVNASLDTILEFLGEMQLGSQAGVQLHGDEPPELLAPVRKWIALPKELLVRAFRSQDAELTDMRAYLEACQRINALPAAVLLDAFQPGTYGGTGHVLDWNAVAQHRSAALGLPIVLAGGLNADNVAEAIATARPDAVDVASGVESSPGRKDPDKVRAFVERAKKALAET